MTRYTNKNRKDVSFSQVDWDYIKLQPYRQTSMEDKKFQKLSKRYCGPYQIIERLGPVAYNLTLHSTSCIHPRYLVSISKRHHRNPSA